MKTIRKALDILEVFLNGEEQISISELAEITGQNVSTIHGILHELAERGYIRQRQKRGKYSLGLKFLSFSDTINKMMAIEEIFHPYMVELSKETNETVNIAINKDNYAVNIGVVHSSHNLRVIGDERIGAPLYCTGVGKILLAGMSNEELERFLKDEKLTSYTLKTITNAKRLKRQIDKARREGIAYDFEEYQIGVRNVAAPIKNHGGKIIAAIAVLAPSVRLSRTRVREITPIIQRYASQISEVMGYREASQLKASAISK